jgi:hypothetical protein
MVSYDVPLLAELCSMLEEGTGCEPTAKKNVCPLVKCKWKKYSMLKFKSLNNTVNRLPIYSLVFCQTRGLTLKLCVGQINN